MSSYEGYPRYGSKPPAIQAVPDEDSLALVYGSSRIGEEQRQRTLAHLTDMYSHGYISEEVHDARREYVLKAVNNKQLLHVISDLPPLPEPQEIPEPGNAGLLAFIKKHEMTAMPLVFVCAAAFSAAIIAIPATILPSGGPAVWKDIIIAISIIAGTASFIATTITACIWAASAAAD